ncbi:DedA family protein [Alistipes sp. OttesenSCG-928-B03]|nr:DedA family protein [Alistipes sp. OttesenSCG-928-B03]
MEWLAEYGYIGLFFGGFLAATIIPLSSDALLVLLLATGADPVKCVVAATLGNWLGGLTSYGLGWLGKWKWIEKWFKVTPEKLEKQRGRIQKYGSLLAFFTWFPLIGDVISIGLGFYKIDFRKSALFMLIGRATRFILWTMAYFWLSPYFMS